MQVSIKLSVGFIKLVKLPIYIGVFLLVLSILVLGYFLWDNKDYVIGKLGKGPKIAAKVGSELITLDVVKKLSSECNFNEKEATEFLVDVRVLGSWANDEGIKYTADDLDIEETRVSGIDDANKCISLQAKAELLRERLALEITNYREGKFVVVNFGRYKQSSFNTNGLANAEREKLYKEDKEYAEVLVQSIYNDLKANKTTFAEAIEKVRNDSRVGFESWYSTAPQSGSFTASEYIKKQGLLSSEAIRQRVDTTSIGDFSEPFVQSVTEDDPNSKPVETRWVIAKVEREGKGSSGSSDDLLQNIRIRYGGRIYL